MTPRMAGSVAVLALTVTVGASRIVQAAETAYNSDGKRDPFIPLVHDGRFVAVAGGGLSKESPVSDLHVAGIVWDPAGSSLALINDTEVKVGDQLGEYRVVEIRPDAVVLLKDGKPVVLQLSFEPPPPSQEQ